MSYLDAFDQVVDNRTCF